MKKPVIFLALIFVNLVIYAQSVSIQLVYPSSTTETKKTQDNKIEETIKNGGYNDFVIQLRDLVVIKLNDAGIKASKDITSDTTEIVTIHAAIFSGGYYMLSSIEVERFQKNANNFLTRKLFKYKNVSVFDFSDVVSDDIVKYLQVNKK